MPSRVDRIPVSPDINRISRTLRLIRGVTAIRMLTSCRRDGCEPMPLCGRRDLVDISMVYTLMWQWALIEG